MLVDASGNPLKSDAQVLAESPCPKCGRQPGERIPSGGFGQVHMICKCGYEFEGKIPCKSVTV